ncbi:MAG: peptidase M10 [Ferruginibacter sp.]
MGIIELDSNSKQLFIHSSIFLYGNLATEQLALQCADEIESMWNEPKGRVNYKGEWYTVVFRIRGFLFAALTPQDIFENDDPRNNYFRVEEFVRGNISFVDGLNCNTGLFKMENLYKGSTTAAHEYGHTLGLSHPPDMDFRGRGAPGIMYPRGTLVDPPFQYNPLAKVGEPGSTMHPMHRKVRQEDIDDLKLNQFNLGRKESIIIGEFSSVYHEAHTSNDA